MKKSVILLELIFSILILSIVGIYSMLFINNLYKTNSQNLEITNVKLDLQTTSVFLQRIIENSLKIEATSNEINFYKIDTQGFKSQNYSGYAVLDESSKEYVKTPYSKITQTKNQYIYFDDAYIYEIENSFEDDKIYFKDKQSFKRIYEHYKLIKHKSKIHFSNNTLYLNDSVLLKNVSSFESKILKDKLQIDICTKICQMWSINI